MASPADDVEMVAPMEPKSPMKIHVTSFGKQFKAAFLKNLAWQRRQMRMNICLVSVAIILCLAVFATQIFVDSLDIGTNVPANLSPPEVAILTLVQGTKPDIPYSDDPSGSALPIVEKMYGYGTLFNYSRVGDGETLLSNIYNDWCDWEKEGTYNYALEFSNVVLESDRIAMDVVAQYNNSERIKFVSLAYNYTLPRLYGAAGGLINTGKALLDYVMNYTATSTRQVKNFPYEAYTIKIDITGTFMSMFCVMILHMPIPVIMSLLIFEKTNGLSQFARAIGLKSSASDLAMFLYALVIYTIIVVLLVATGSILGFAIFLENNFFNYFLFFLLYGPCCVSQAFFFASFVKSTRFAALIGFVYAYLAADLSNAVLMTVELPAASSSFSKFFLIPPVGVTRTVTEYAWWSTGYGGISFSKFYDPDHVILYSWICNLVWAVIFMILSWYLDAILQTTSPHYHKPFFFLKCSETPVATPKIKLDNPSALDDPDVLVEISNADDPSFDVRIQGLTHFYPGSKYAANDNLCFGLEEGAVLGLIGPNGAGKTTLINSLCGLVKPTDGTADIFGHDLLSDMGLLHSIVGLCPQKSILWSDLSGREHLEFVGRIKGLVGDELQAEVDSVLASVELDEPDVQSRLAGAYSGGMRRRLSMAMALIGSRLILVDEASTGLDPASRQKLWSIIARVSPGRIIILTTHSMEEAATLSSKIAVLARGRIHAIAPNLSLKRRYGSGYRLQVSLGDSGPQGSNRFERWLRGIVPDAELLSMIADYREYAFSESHDLATIFEHFMTEAPDNNVVDWGISQASLEAVFDHVVNAADEQHNRVFRTSMSSVSSM